MRFFMLRGTELKPVTGVGPQVDGQHFEAIPSKVKGYPEVNLPYECPTATKFGQ